MCVCVLTYICVFGAGGGAFFFFFFFWGGGGLSSVCLFEGVVGKCVLYIFCCCCSLSGMSPGYLL